MYQLRLGNPPGALVIFDEGPPTRIEQRSGVGAAYRNRTDDLFITSELLYRLS